MKQVDNYSRQQLLASMKQLRLGGMAQAYDEVMNHALKRNASTMDILGKLFEHEVHNRQANAMKNRIRAAKFPVSKDVNDFVFTGTPINSDSIMQLYKGDFVKDLRNIVLVGGTGTGKTHLAIAIAAKATRMGYKSRFFNLVDITNQLEREKLDGNSGRLIKQLEKIDVIVLDELGYLPFSKAGAQMLFHLLSKLHLNTAIIITSNLTFGEWNTIFHDQKMTTALLDRICYNCEIIETGNQSYRLKKKK